MDKSFLDEVGKAQIEIGVHWGGVGDSFEDVTFLVSNQEDQRLAIDRVWAFIEEIVKQVELGRE